MQVSVYSADGAVMLKLEGRFDFNAHRDFRAGVDLIAKEAKSHQILVDLQDVDYIDSSALGMLLMLRDKAVAERQSVSLLHCRGSVRQVLDIANFGKLFTIA